MKRIIPLLCSGIFFVLPLSTVKGANPPISVQIQDSDCDTASKSLGILIEDLKKNTVTPKVKKTLLEILKNNIEKYAGDPEKCVMVNPDFVKLLSIDALGELKDPSSKRLFLSFLNYTSPYQPGDMRQRSAIALAKLKASDTVKEILNTARDKTTYLVGFRESETAAERPTIEDSIANENRDLRKDSYSYPILEALKIVSQKKDFDLIKNAIFEEQELSLQGKSNWNDPIRGDMLRIASSLNDSESLELINMHQYLPVMMKIKALAFIQSNKAVAPLSQIIEDTAKLGSDDIPLETKLAFVLLSRIKSKEAKAKIEFLSASSDPTVSFLAKLLLLRNRDKRGLAEIRNQILILPDKLKIEGMKFLSSIGDRNSIPIIKKIYALDNLKLKVYSIWALSNLKVIDLKEDALKLRDSINSREEEASKLNLKESIDDAVKSMGKAKKAY